MFGFTFLEWLTLFYLYGFIGWCWEVILVSFEQKRLVSRGFLRIPILPLYGFGATVIMAVTLPVSDNPTLVFVFGAVACTVLEYIVGVLLESLFNIKYWDYSNYEYNYKGRVAALSSMLWGVASLFMTYQLYGWSQNIVAAIPHTTMVVTVSIVSVLFVADVIYSIKTAIDIKLILKKLTAIKEKIESLRLSTKQEHKDQIEKLNTEKKSILSRIPFYGKAMLRDNPSATSKKFAEALKELKSNLFSSFKK